MPGPAAVEMPEPVPTSELRIRLLSPNPLLCDTVDLVQEALVRVIEGLEGVEVRGPSGFQAYVRQAVLNRDRCDDGSSKW